MKARAGSPSLRLRAFWGCCGERGRVARSLRPPAEGRQRPPALAKRSAAFRIGPARGSASALLRRDKTVALPQFNRKDGAIPRTPSVAKPKLGAQESQVIASYRKLSQLGP